MNIKHKQPFWVMNDHQLRNALKRRILYRCMKDKSGLLLEEVGLAHGAVKADLVLVRDTLHGFEIKSDGDTLHRLANQMRFYSSVFDRVTLVVGYRHAYESLQMVPEWWGVTVAHLGLRGAIQFSYARSAQSNPSPDVRALAKLLWRDEALALLGEIGLSDGMRSKPRAAIHGRVAEVAKFELVRSWVCQQFKSRAGWKSGALRTPDGG